MVAVTLAASLLAEIRSTSLEVEAEERPVAKEERGATELTNVSMTENAVTTTKKTSMKKKMGLMRRLQTLC